MENTGITLHPAVPNAAMSYFLYRNNQTHPAHYHANLIPSLKQGKTMCIPKNFFNINFS